MRADRRTLELVDRLQAEGRPIVRHARPLMDAPPAVDDAAAEKEFQAEVVKQAKRCGWWTFHVLNSKGSAPGWVDLVLMKPPRIIFAELKSETGRLSPEQQTVIDALRACGQTVFVWRPADRSAIAAML